MMFKILPEKLKKNICIVRTVFIRHRVRPFTEMSL